MRTIITSEPADGAGDACRPTASARAAGEAYGRGRTSVARESIAATAAAMDSAFTVEDLAGAVRAQRSSTGLATVYRAVAAMEASGFLERVGERQGTALYARCGAGGHHHHHVVCTACGATAVTSCPISKAVEAAEDAGFTVTGHDVRLYGLCGACSPGPDRPANPEGR